MSTETISTEQLLALLNTIPDPEVPAISIVELGVVRNISYVGDVLEIKITPTYSGCPAMKVMEEEIEKKLQASHITNYKIRTVLSPAWTTDWLSDGTKQKLKAYGIAPPEQSTASHLENLLNGKRKNVTCPYCNSTDTKLTSAFGSTACKALHYCNGCQQPFEEFKCH